MSEALARTGYAYVRVSTDKQEELSPDAQLRLIKEYAQKNGILLTEVFMENGISGRKAEKRPEFMRMIGQAKNDNNHVDVILVWKFSRFARNQEESIVYKSLLKKQHNIDVVSISEPLIDGPFGSLIERIIEWMDEYYSIRLSGEVIRGMTEKAMRGGYQSRPPFGYRKASGKIPVIEPDEAALVLAMFQKYTNENITPTDLTRWLNDSGHRTIRKNLFDSRCVKYMLQNPFYTGLVRWNYTDRGRVLKPEDEWITVEGEHEPIIDRDLWNRTQDTLKHRLRPYRQRSVSTCKHWLSGLLVCSSCGKTLSHAATGGFQCWSYTKGLCKESHYISERRAVNAVITGLESYLQSDSFEYEILAPTAPLSTPDPVDNLTRQLNELTHKEERIKEAYRNGVDTLSEYKANKAILLREREYLHEELEKAKTMAICKPEQVISQSEVVTAVSDVIDMIKNQDIAPVVKGNALRSICSKISYDKKNEHMDFHISICQQALIK